MGRKGLIVSSGSLYSFSKSGGVVVGSALPSARTRSTLGREAESPETEPGPLRHKGENPPESLLSFVELGSSANRLIHHASRAVQHDRDRSRPGSEAADDFIAGTNGDARVGRVAGRRADRHRVGNRVDRNGCRSDELLAAEKPVESQYRGNDAGAIYRGVTLKSVSYRVAKADVDAPGVLSPLYDMEPFRFGPNLKRLPGMGRTTGSPAGTMPSSPRW